MGLNNTDMRERINLLVSHIENDTNKIEQALHPEGEGGEPDTRRAAFYNGMLQSHLEEFFTLLSKQGSVTRE